MINAGRVDCLFDLRALSMLGDLREAPIPAAESAGKCTNWVFKCQRFALTPHFPKNMLSVWLRIWLIFFYDPQIKQCTVFCDEVFSLSARLGGSLVTKKHLVLLLSRYGSALGLIIEGNI